MNAKAKKLENFFKENKLDGSFQVAELEDGITVFRSFVELGEVGEDKYNLIIGVDNSPYTIIRVFFGKEVGILKDKNYAEKIFKLNRENDIFKLYINADGELVLDVVLPTSEESFDPQFIQAFLQLLVTNLPNIYKDIK